MMRHNENIDWNLAGRILSGEATSEEVRTFELWLSEKDNQKEWELIEKEIEHVDYALVAENVDLQQAWNNVKERTIHKKSRKIQLVFAAVAASIVIAFALYIFPYQDQFFNTKPIVVQTSSALKSINLNDGSIVEINRNSTFLYPDKFSANERKVTLNGEAYFNIERNKEKPFIIETSSIQIKVLGTSFNVKAYPGSNVNEVVVNSGTVEVQLLHESSNKLILKKGDKAIYNRSDNSFIKIKTKNANSFAWKTKEIEFRNENLADAINLIEEVYNVNIETPENFNINDARITATFDKNTIESIISVINQTYGIELTYTAN